jgi:hypothetical protein
MLQGTAKVWIGGGTRHPALRTLTNRRVSAGRRALNVWPFNTSPMSSPHLGHSKCSVERFSTLIGSSCPMKKQGLMIRRSHEKGNLGMAFIVSNAITPDALGGIHWTNVSSTQ